MGRFIAARPRRGQALDHLADVAISLDQLGHEFRRQVETGLLGEPFDVVVGGWRLGHASACHAGLAPVTPSSTTKVARRCTALSFCFTSSTASKATVQRAAVRSTVA